MDRHCFRLIASYNVYIEILVIEKEILFTEL